jgi:hypothetical protein
MTVSSADLARRERLRAAAGAGDLEAMADLGVSLLMELPFDVREALRLLQAAAEGGEPEAAHLVAVLYGAGAGLPQSWDKALAWLQRAAELGSWIARAQLGVLTSDAAAAAEIDQGSDEARLWGRAVRGIDLGMWLAPPPKYAVMEAPRIRASAGFLPHAACDWLIARAKPRLSKARVYDAATGDSKEESARSNSATDFSTVESDMVLTLVRARIGIAVGLPPPAMEQTGVLHYEVGQRFERHHDWLDPKEPGFAAEIARRGQRLITFLVYLNEGYEGGETEFLSVGYRHKGRKGDALFWANVDRAGAPDPLTLHAGTAPANGEKWVLSQWIRDRAPVIP